MKICVNLTESFSSLPSQFKLSQDWLLKIGINNLTQVLWRNLFPSNVIENVVRKFHNNNFPSDSFQSTTHKKNCLYFKLPYIGPFSITAQRRIKKLVSTFCSDLDI